MPSKLTVDRAPTTVSIAASAAIFPSGSFMITRNVPVLRGVKLNTFGISTQPTEKGALCRINVPVVVTSDSSRVTEPVQPLANRVRAVPTVDTWGATPIEKEKLFGKAVVKAIAFALIAPSRKPK